MGRKARWQTGDTAEAALDLEPRPGEELSAYRLLHETEAEAETVAIVHVLVFGNGSKGVDFFSVPDALLQGLGLTPVPVPSPDLPEYLRCRHHEIPGLQDDELRNRLASLLLEQKTSAQRVSRGKVKKRAGGVLRMASIAAESLCERWREYLGL